MDWFLYDNGLRHERVKQATSFYSEVINKWNLIILIKHSSVFFESKKINSLGIKSHQLKNQNRGYRNRQMTNYF